MQVAPTDRPDKKNSAAGNSSLPPALHALLVQVFALLVPSLVFLVMKYALDRTLPSPFFVLLQAATAAALAFLRGQDWWWWLIQFCFPIVAVVMLAVALPPYFYLIAFAVMTLVFWSTFRTQVPYYPSKASLLPIILAQLPKDRALRFMDVGSGMGGLLIKLSACRPDCEFHGVEIAPLPWLISRVRAWLARANVRLNLQDYAKLNFGNYDVVFAYLSPAVMPALWEKVRGEMRPGTLLMSYEFIIPDVLPDSCINSGENAPFLYVWRI